MTDKIFLISVTIFIIFFSVMLGNNIYGSYKYYKNPIPQTKLIIKFEQVQGYSNLFDELTCIFTYQLPEKPTEYCKCLAAAGVNEINKNHNKYTERIWKHNPKTITKGIKFYNDSTKK